jgi:hypothetical protein
MAAKHSALSTSGTLIFRLRSPDERARTARQTAADGRDAADAQRRPVRADTNAGMGWKPEDMLPQYLLLNAGGFAADGVPSLWVTAAIGRLGYWASAGIKSLGGVLRRLRQRPCDGRTQERPVCSIAFPTQRRAVFWRD